MDLKKTTDKVWLCESVGKLKGVGKLAIAKMNELRINTIADLQLHVRHCGKVPVRGFDQIYAMTLQAIRVILRLLSRTTGKRRIHIIRDM